jgi:general secretion pathway protein B
MSFILDALKKSETDRQRQTGPALFEVKVAPPKARFPVWAVAIVALLVVNMIIVGWLLLRRSSRGDEAAAQNAPPAATGQAPQTPSPNSGTWSPSVRTIPPPAAASTPPNSLPNTSASSNTGTSQTYAPPPTEPAGAPQRPSMSRAPGEESSQPPVHLPDRDQNEPTLAGATKESGADSGGARADDFAPATDPGEPIFKGHMRRGTESGLMLYQDLAVANGSNLPELRLDLHVYAANPQERFALINMGRVHEGETLKDGVRVEAITPDGVVMSHNGTKFLLPRE